MLKNVSPDKEMEHADNYNINALWLTYCPEHVTLQPVLCNLDNVTIIQTLKQGE